jgi:hypothetical protein
MRACGKQESFDGLGPGATLIISTAKAPREGLANPVGPDIVSRVPWHPLNLWRLEGCETRRYAPIENGYSTRSDKKTNLLPGMKIGPLISAFITSIHLCQANQGVWEKNRLTAGQPFPAKVIGVAPSWVGYELLLEELDEKKPRFCYVNVAITFALKYTLTTRGASENLLINKPTSKWTILPKAIPVSEFNYSGGGYKIGKKYGDEDLLLRALANKRSAEKGGTGGSATRPESKSEGEKKSQPESAGRSR